CDRPAPSVASGFRQSLPERRLGWLLKILSNQEKILRQLIEDRSFLGTEMTREYDMKRHKSGAVHYPNNSQRYVKWKT
ncbi:MAG: hypothetical protein ABFS02_00650, partial [Pseudomonadota bacterium]